MDSEGEPEFIHFSNHGHSSYFNGSIDEYEAWLAAIKLFIDILYEFSIKIKTDAGK